MSHRFTVRALLLAGLLLSGALEADEAAVRGRQVIEKHKDAVVTVILTVKESISMMGMGQEGSESKQEATGTVIGPDGLTVVSLSATDPMALMTGMMGGMIGGMGDSFDMRSEVQDVKLLLADRTELPAAIVLRDRELDLAFVRPKDTPAAPLSYLDMTHAGEAEALDRLVAIQRLGRVANRVHGGAFVTVQAVVRKPRLFYVSATSMSGSFDIGQPVLTLDGTVVGLTVLRMIKGESSGGGILSGMMNATNNLTAIILPAADILDAAAQAPPYVEEPAPAGAEETETAAPLEAGAGG